MTDIETHLGRMWDLHATEPAETVRLFLEHEEALLHPKWMAKGLLFVMHFFADHRGDTETIARFAQKVWEQRQAAEPPTQEAAAVALVAVAQLDSRHDWQKWAQMALAEVENEAQVVFKARALVGAIQYGRGHLMAAAAQLASTRAEAQALNLSDALKRVAIVANNTASDLLERVHPERAIALPLLATVAREAWHAVGGWREKERADWLLSRVWLDLRAWEKAWTIAQQGLACVEENGNDPLERLFLISLLAASAEALGHASASQWHAEVKALMDAPSVEGWMREEVEKILKMPKA